MALLFLAEPAVNTWISVDHDPSQPVLGSTLRIMGFGNTSSLDRLPDSRLHEINVKSVTNDSCASDAKVLCAGNVVGGIRNGDSGGPLTTTGPMLTLVGTVNGGPARAQRSGVPGYYARMSGFAGWIDGAISSYRAKPLGSSNEQINTALAYCAHLSPVKQFDINSIGDIGGTAKIRDQVIPFQNLDSIG